MLAVSLAIALLGFLLSGTFRRVVVISGLLVALGLLLADVRSAQVAAPRLYHWLSAAPIVGTVEDVRPQAGGERYSLRLRRDATLVDPAVTLRLSWGGELPPGLAAGARIKVRASLGPIARPATPGANDPARRAWFDAVSASGRILDPPEVLEPAAAAGRFDRWRAQIGDEIATQLGGDAGAIAGALTVGEQGRIRADLLEAMRVAGLAHILTVSGFHIGLVVAGSFLLLRRLLALWSWLALRVSIRVVSGFGAGLMGTAYTLLSGTGLPSIRSILAAWVVLFAMMLGRDPLAPRLIAFAAFVILVFRPEALLSPSFQLSFAAVTALAALAHSKLGQRLRAEANEGWLRKGGKFVVGLMLTGLVAELVLGPIALAHFGRAGTYGVLANMVAVPLTSFLIMPLLAAWLALAPLGLGWLVAWALVPSLQALAQIGLVVASWPGASLTLPAMPDTAVFTLFVGALLLLLLTGRLRFLGVPILAIGLALALFGPRPDLFVAADGRQVGMVTDGRMYTLRGHRDGYLIRNWAEQSDTRASARFSDLSSAECNALACRVPLAGGRLLLSFFRAPPANGPTADSWAAACAAVDLVTSPEGLPHVCQPRWLRLDPEALITLGAVAIDSKRSRIETVGKRAGDQPWSPAASPGMRPRLLGKPLWTGVIIE